MEFSGNGKETISIPRIVISSTKGKSGKTLVTVMLLKHLINSGYRVSAFKNGPDFIDPGYHQAVTGSPSRNLDFFLMGSTLVERFHRYSSGSDISLIEGNHGLYDSVDGISELGSTAQLAKMLGAPVLLVLDGSRTNRTLGAILKGLATYDPEIKVIGVVLTNIIPRQYEKIKSVIEKNNIPVLGVVYRNRQLEEMLTYRHLGLKPVAESGNLVPDELAERNSVSSFNIPEIMSRSIENSREIMLPARKSRYEKASRSINFGILGGRAFTFYYPETIERSGSLGNLRFIDAERDPTIGDVDVLLIGGGFPEIYAETLEKNRSLLSSIRTFSGKGGTIYAECGGLMYLTDSIVFNNNEFNMTGIIEGTAIISNRPVAHGYSTAKVLQNIPIARKGEILRGHEFHYSRIHLSRSYDFKLYHEKGSGIDHGKDGIQVGNTYAHYMHLHPEVNDFVLSLVRKATSTDTVKR